MKKIFISLLLSFNIIGTFSFLEIEKNKVFSSEMKETLIIEGNSLFEGNIEFSERKAISEALKKAVSKVLALWIKNDSIEKISDDKKDDILDKYEEYIKDYKLLSKKINGDFYTVNVEVTVKMEEIKNSFKQKVKSISKKLANPSISFVLTTWEKIGNSTTKMQENTNETSIENKASDSVKSINSYDTPDSSYLDAYANNPNLSLTHKTKFIKKSTTGILNEEIWKKYPDPSIIDNFKGEFLERNFIVKSADKTLRIALSNSQIENSVNAFDRESVRIFAQKEGVNFVVRGEVSILKKTYNENTASNEILGVINTEIIDVDSGNVLSIYSNSAKAISDSEESAKFQLIKKLANLASKTLSKETLIKWEDFIENGRPYIIELENITSPRNQQEPFLACLKELNIEINSITSDKPKNTLFNITYKGKKDDLNSNIQKKLGNKKGFSEKEFNGPIYRDGKIIFTFFPSKK